MSKWRFYGREEEFERLEETLRFRGDPGNFASVRILGRRGVGKTEFMREAALRAKGNPPVLHIELPSPEKGSVTCSSWSPKEPGSFLARKLADGGFPTTTLFSKSMFSRNCSQIRQRLD